MAVSLIEHLDLPMFSEHDHVGPLWQDKGFDVQLLGFSRCNLRLSSKQPLIQSEAIWVAVKELKLSY